MNKNANTNDTRIIIYDLTGNNQVLNSYDNEDTFKQDNNNLFKDAIFLNKDEQNKIHTIDDVIKCLEDNKTYIGTVNSYKNSNYSNCWTKTIDYKVFHIPEQDKQEEKSSRKNNNNKNIEQNNPKNNFFYIKCDDRCYLRFKLPLIFDCKTKMLYHNEQNSPNITNETQKNIVAFSIPNEDKFILSIHDYKKSKQPTRDNMLHTFGCDYRVDKILKRMYYVNNHSYNFEKYQYLVDFNTTEDFQPLPLDYFDNIYDGFKNKGISTLPKTLFGYSSYDNVTANLCCLDCRWGPIMPEPKTMKWETIIQKFTLDTLNNLKKNRKQNEW